MTEMLGGEDVQDDNISLCGANQFPLLQLPILVVEKIISYIQDPFDLKCLRSCCKCTRDLVNRNPDLLIHLKVVLNELKDLEALVKNESKIPWSNFRFPPRLLKVGCRRHYAETFNELFTEFVDIYAGHIQILEMDRFDWSNPTNIKLLQKCQKLKCLKVDSMQLKSLSESELDDHLNDEDIDTVLGNLEDMDVVAFEFLDHNYQYEFMGKLLEKCTRLRQLGSWGYFPEWEQPVGGSIHLKHFVWPLLVFMRKRVPVLDLMLETVTNYEEFVQLGLPFLNESMDWQAGKWVVDVRANADSDFTGIESFLYSRIKSYVHRAVGWFDESEFRKCGLSLMKNLTTIHIHNARDINLTSLEEMPSRPTFQKLENLTLIVGNRLGASGDNLPLEKVVVDVLLNAQRHSVTNLKLDIDLNHHDQHGSISLPAVIQNFPNLTSFCVEEWAPSDGQLLAIYEAFPRLEVLMFCGRNISDAGILGINDMDMENHTKQGIHKLTSLRILKIFSIRLPPKNVFPLVIKENSRITDLCFEKGFSQLPLRKFHFLIKSERITIAGIKSLLEEPFSCTAVEFLMNWLPEGFDSVESFQELGPTFKFLDPQTFLEPSNFVIPDIGKWVL